MASTEEKADEKYMREALRQAKKAYDLGEVPIGCVIVSNETGQIVGRGYNRRNTDRTTLSHAEISAIRKASKKTGDWRLEGCTIYITLEPCPMCAGAIVQARIDRCVYAAASDKAGCAGTVLNLLQQPGFNHRVETARGILEEESTALLRRFFKELRIRIKDD
ncbi:MAG TPA: tRNA-specific adenosine deaminase [Lachnospiraceae bacterium]|nr:tRNA adenosine(34) deaminase TadA [Lachnospiraceae bacterium]MCR4786311.1 tRNA adenosine(34) deaminase TadA [Lachnospiraceae bacterium]HAL32338.1 tRNA-specific adenosine deaminase [Lachnospiraceae bacterium]